MPTIQKKTAIGANSVTDNVITGNQYEFMPYNAALFFGFSASATGLVIDVYSGSDTLTEALEPNIAASFPVYPDNFPLDDIAAAGERIKIRARNTTGGSIDLYTTVKINPV